MAIASVRLEQALRIFEGHETVELPDRYSENRDLGEHRRFESLCISCRVVHLSPSCAAVNITPRI